MCNVRDLGNEVSRCGLALKLKHCTIEDEPEIQGRERRATSLSDQRVHVYKSQREAKKLKICVNIVRKLNCSVAYKL